MEIKLTKRDIIWSYIGTILSMGINFIMLPFLMYFLDGDMLGLWYVFASIGALATLFDFGFGVTFARNITYAWSGARSLKKEGVNFSENITPDFILIKKVLLTCKIIYGIIAGASILALLTVGTYYIMYISREVEGNSQIVAWIIYSIGIFLNLYYGYYASFLRGVGNVAQANKNTVYARVIQLVLMVALLVSGFDLLGVCVAYLAYGTVFRLLGKKYFYQYKNIGYELSLLKEKIPRKEIREMVGIVWHNAWRDGLIAFSNYFCIQASTIICSLYLSLAETGVYSIGVQLATAIAVIAGTMYNTYQPELQSAYVLNDRAKMCKIMSVIVMSFVYLYLAGIILFCLGGMPILKFIRPSATVSYPVLLGLCAYQFILQFRNCYTSYFSCTNRIIYLRAFLCSAILCIVLSLFLAGSCQLGIWGLIMAQIISQAVYNLWKWPLLAHRELHLSAGNMICAGSRELVQSCLRRRKS